MKLILCTLLGFAVLVIGLALICGLAYFTGRALLAVKDKLWRPRYHHPYDTTDIYECGAVTIALALLGTVFSYLIGKGICQ